MKHAGWLSLVVLLGCQSVVPAEDSCTNAASHLAGCGYSLDGAACAANPGGAEELLGYECEELGVFVGSADSPLSTLFGSGEPCANSEGDSSYRTCLTLHFGARPHLFTGFVDASTELEGHLLDAAKDAEGYIRAQSSGLRASAAEIALSALVEGAVDPIQLTSDGTATYDYRWDSAAFEHFGLDALVSMVEDGWGDRYLPPQVRNEVACARAECDLIEEFEQNPESCAGEQECDAVYRACSFASIGYERSYYGGTGSAAFNPEADRCRIARRRQEDQPEGEEGRYETLTSMSFTNGVLGVAGVWMGAKAEASAAWTRAANGESFAALPDYAQYYWTTVFFNATSAARRDLLQNPYRHEESYSGGEDGSAAGNAAWRTATYLHMTRHWDAQTCGYYGTC